MLAGLVDKIDFFRYTTTDDGAGGFEENAESAILGGLKCRATLLDTETQLRELGYSGKNCWKLLVEPKTGLDNDGDVFCRVTSGTTSNKLNSSRVYRCFKVSAQEDEFGKFHHWTIWVQQEADKDA
tara:strand:+ start:1504 stop:1881 length:378 start_codon:yes stop_codon:yes gene_type:complete